MKNLNFTKDYSLGKSRHVDRMMEFPKNAYGAISVKMKTKKDWNDLNESCHCSGMFNEK